MDLFTGILDKCAVYMPSTDRLARYRGAHDGFRPPFRPPYGPRPQRQRLCRKNLLLRVVALGDSDHIHEYCVLRSHKMSTEYAVRVQVDLVQAGARFVLVRVPYNDLTEPELFTRPFVFGSIIPRAELKLVNSVIKALCGRTL